MSSSVATWSPPPPSLALGDDEVHVWRAELDPATEVIERLQQTLAADERERADHFYFERDRRHFTVARGVLRALLGRYLGEEPNRLRFNYSPHGKPALATDGDLRFNLSHSHGLALYAFARGRELGIDLERHRPDVADEGIAERFFSRAEVEALQALPRELRPEGFFNCWTRKEAYIKARGEGLSLALDRFDVSLAPGEPAALLSLRGNLQEAARWSLRALAPGAGYAAALAVEGQGWELKCWRWE